MDEFTHHAQGMDNGAAGTASRNHLLPDSFHLFIFMGLFKSGAASAEAAARWVLIGRTLAAAVWRDRRTEG